MTSNRQLTAFALFLSACSGHVAPTERRDAEPPPSVQVAQAMSVQVAPPVMSVAASAEPQGADTPATSSPSPTGEEVPGRGMCQRDDDCVLTRYQEGCCVQGCQDYASGRRELAARRAKENCAAQRGEMCPPPAPCRPPSHRVIAAKCSAGACVAIQVPIAP